jgi:hypothetical protein
VATDPNVDSEYVGLSPLSLDDIRNFFDSHIKPYAPYREEKVYNTLINTLSEYYYGQVYTVIPNELKQIYEDANFETPEIYNQLLIAIGVPQTIIDNISLADKLIFLKTLADFERYKGTISFFQKVAETFNDRVSIYELFIDRNSSGDWVFKPVKVYLNDDMSLNVNDIPYATLYNAVPTLLLSESQLTELYSNEQLILPIKSNLMLLDNDLMTDVSILYDIIVAIFLHEYKEDYIDIYFKDDAKTVQLKTIYYLWYYLLTRYYGIPWTAFAAQPMLRFIYGDVTFPAFIGSTPTTISELDKIIDRYNSIEIVSTATRDYDNCGTLRDEFYKDIADSFYTFSGGSAKTDTDMYNELLILNSALITYVDDRITNTSIGKQAEINLILTEIYSSLLLYASTYSGDIYFSQYVDYFLRYLPQVLINPENTTSYTILYNLKPYHVDLYSIANTGIRCQDKFNQVFIDDESNTNFLYQIMYASLLTFSDECLFNYVFNAESNVNLLNNFTFNVFASLPDEDEASNISDSNILDLIYPISSVENISDDDSNEIIFSPEISMPIISIFSQANVEIPTTDDESVDLYDEAAMDYRTTITSILQTSTDYLMELNKDLVSDVICVESYTVTKVL